MQAITLTGRVGGDAEVRQASGGDVASFNMAVDQGYGERKTTNWFRVSIWGARGAKLAPHILKGNKIAVSGDLEIGEYNGKPQFNVRANDVDPWLGNGGSPAARGDAPSRAATAEPAFDDSDVPF